MVSSLASLQFPLLSLPAPSTRVPLILGTPNPVKTLARVLEGRRRRSSSLALVVCFLCSDLGVPSSRKTPEKIARVLVSRAAMESQVPRAPPLQICIAADVVREYYHVFNCWDLALMEVLIGEDCVYEDLLFSQPFIGHEAILEFFNKLAESISIDLQFVIDDISNEDISAVGVTWHLEWHGKPFPFSKGCSFYHAEVLDGKRQIIYGRDCMEPAIKLGEMALGLVKGATWILQRFPQLADQL